MAFGPQIPRHENARENGQPTCSQCGDRCAGYDTSPTARRFEFIPLWMIPVVLVYTMRRVQCPRCGVKVESVPWAEVKKSTDDRVQVVPCRVGPPHELAGSGGQLSGELGSRAQLGKTGSFVGIIASQPG